MLPDRLHAGRIAESQKKSGTCANLDRGGPQVRDYTGLHKLQSLLSARQSRQSECPETLGGTLFLEPCWFMRALCGLLRYPGGIQGLYMGCIGQLHYGSLLGILREPSDSGTSHPRCLNLKPDAGNARYHHAHACRLVGRNLALEAEGLFGASSGSKQLGVFQRAAVALHVRYPKSRG